jgi:hypothetical protein
VRDARVAGPAGLRIDRVEGVGHQREAIARPPQADQPRRVAGQVHHLEARDVVALADGPGDLHRPAVPEREHRPERRPAVHVQGVQLEVVRPAVALGVGDLVRMAVHRDVAQRRRDAAVVGVRVAEHDPRQPAELPGGQRDRARHLPDPRVEQQDAVAVADQVHVHGLRHPAADDPDAVGDLLGAGGDEPREARTGADAWGHARRV